MRKTKIILILGRPGIGKTKLYECFLGNRPTYIGAKDDEKYSAPKDTSIISGLTEKINLRSFNIDSWKDAKRVACIISSKKEIKTTEEKKEVEPYSFEHRERIIKTLDNVVLREIETSDQEINKGVFIDDLEKIMSLAYDFSIKTNGMNDTFKMWNSYEKEIREWIDALRSSNLNFIIMACTASFDYEKKVQKIHINGQNVIQYLIDNCDYIFTLDHISCFSYETFLITSPGASIEGINVLSKGGPYELNYFEQNNIARLLMDKILKIREE